MVRAAGPARGCRLTPGPPAPQTLLTDRARLQQLEAQVRQLTVLASVLLVSSSFSGSVLFGSPQFVDKLKRLTKALLEEFKCR